MLYSTVNYIHIVNVFQPENESEDSGPLVQTKLSSGHPDNKALCSPLSSALESTAVRYTLLPQPLEPVLVSPGIFINS